MSTTLLTADNISVKGHRYTVTTYGHSPNQSASKIPQWVPHSTDIEWSEVVSDAVHIDFTLLINGKLKTFGWSFIVNKIANDTVWYYELAQWSDWNAIYFILENLGYGFNENKYWFGQWSIRKWVDQLMMD
jgi:hypothetical protein